MADGQHIIICKCAQARLVPMESVEAARTHLERAGFTPHVVGDLCLLAARKDPLLSQVSTGATPVVLACYPRAVKWLFAAAGAPPPTEGAKLLNLREQAVEVILRELDHATAAPGNKPTPPANRTDLTDPTDLSDLPWPAWFPVVDFDRCTQCMQCLSFCLFGVFGVSADRRLQVVNPESCKPNCPACARVCPEAAIIFPKCPATPMNGAEVGDLRREAMRVDISALLGGDVYDKIRARNQQARERFSKERDPQTALDERRKYLADLAQDIPPEILMTLPGMDEIKKRAEAAQQRAKAALANPAPPNS